jgi:hypothetical protein
MRNLTEVNVDFDGGLDDIRAGNVNGLGGRAHPLVIRDQEEQFPSSGRIVVVMTVLPVELVWFYHQNLTPQVLSEFQHFPVP